MIGRRAEVRILEDRRVRARSTSSAVLVSGPAGIGKSDLVRDLAGSVVDAGGSVGWGVAGEWAGASPYWPWIEALTALGVDTDGVLSPADASEALGEGAARAAVFASVAEAMVDAAADHPVMVAIEDLHRAEPTTRDLFVHLASRPLPAPLLLVATARPGHDAIDRLRVDRVEVAPWTPEDVAEAARQRDRSLDVATVATLHARAGGNPLFVLRLLERADPLAGPVPADVRALLAEQVAALPGDTRASVEALAVLGSGTPAELLDEVVEGAPRAATDPAIAAGLLHIEGHLARFDHDLIREAVYESLAPPRRALLHERAAIALSRRIADPGVVAHHYSRAARAELGRPAADLARQAGQAALSAGALPEAVRYHEQARSALHRCDDREDELDFVLDHARALSFARRIAEAEQVLLDAEELARTPDQRRRFLAEHGRLRWREEPNTTILRAGELARITRQWFATAGDDATVVARETALVAVAEIEGMTTKALPAADAALTAAERHGGDQVRAEAHLARRRALMVHHRSLRERRIDSDAALAAAERAGDQELAGRARRLAVADAMAAGDRTAAVALMAPAQRSPSSALVEHVALWRAGMAALEGRSAEAGALLVEARDHLDAQGVHSAVLEYVATAYAWDSGTLSDLLSRYEPILATVADPTVRAGSALAAVIDSDIPAAQGHLDVALELLLEPDITPLWLVGAGVAAEVAAALDDPRCQALYDVLVGYSGECIVPAAAAVPFLGSVDRPLGLLCLRLDDLPRALDHLHTSLRVHQAMHARPWEARSHAALAVARAREGGADDAARHASEAERLRTDLGMGDVLLLGRFDPEDPAPGSVAGAATSPRQGRLRATGDHWEVGLDGVGGAVAPLVGLTYIARLVGDGGRDWHVLDLADAPGGTAAPEGHGGEVLDEKARRAYRHRYQDLTATLERADADADRATAERARVELDALEVQLLSAYGLAGRVRTLDDPTERTRINVQRAVNRAIARVAAVSPPLADHLRHRLRTGRSCRYEPDPARPVTWEL